jgi:uncharacterized membrane protein
VARYLTVLVVAGLVLGVAGLPLAAAPGFRGLSLSTPYPAQTIRAGERVTLTLTVKNFGLPPQSVALGVAEAPRGWRAAILGGGRPVAAVYVEPDQDVTVTLQLDPPAGAGAGAFHFLITAQGTTAGARLPVTLTIGQVQPSRLGLSAELPVLRGPSTSSFRYRLTLKNESDRDLLVNLEARTQKSFQVSFTPAFANQQVTSLPVKAGESKDIDAEVTLPRETPAGSYDIVVVAGAGEARAEVKLGLEVTGRPDLSLTTPDGRLSGRAYANRATPFKFVVKNQGGAAARDVELSASEPSGWEVTFDPQRIDGILPNQQREVTASIKPAAKAVTGDYIVTMRASAGEASSSADFRVTVYTSTLWGLTGILLVAIALGVVSLAVSRYGRR